MRTIDLRDYASGLTEVQPGYWVGPEADISYPVSGHSSCFAVENDSFWFQHRNECILAMVRRLPPSGPIFDIGGGNGFVSKALTSEGFPAVLVEPGKAGCDNARARDLPVIARATVETGGFLPSSLPAVGMFDVLEHIENDHDLLKLLLNKLVPGGRLYLTVPALGILWSYEDEHAGHFRRYRRKGIIEDLESAGFLVEYASYVFLPLVLPILVLRGLPTRLGLRTSVDDETTSSEHAPMGKALLTRLLAPEVGRIAKGRTAAPAGTTLLISAARPLMDQPGPE